MEQKADCEGLIKYRSLSLVGARDCMEAPQCHQVLRLPVSLLHQTPHIDSVSWVSAGALPPASHPCFR